MPIPSPMYANLSFLTPPYRYTIPEAMETKGSVGNLGERGLSHGAVES